MLGDLPAQHGDHPVGFADLDIYARTVQPVIEFAASIGNVVIIGRGGQLVLAGRPDVFHVRLIAPLEQRIGYVAYREQLDREAARQRVLTKDRDRQRYAQPVFGRKWSDPGLYDLVINTGGMDLDTAVDEIRLALEQKRRRDSTTPAGVRPYTFEPRDFRPQRQHA